jgi:hypothetical protein
MTTPSLSKLPDENIPNKLSNIVELQNTNK